METLKEGEAIIKITANKCSLESKSMAAGIIICALNDLIVDLIADSANISKKEAAKAAGAALLLSTENYKED